MPSMTETERAALRKCWKMLIDNIHKTQNSEIIDYLISYGVLTENDEESIKLGGTTMDKNRSLVEILLRKPPPAFDKFVETLKRVNQGPLAELLTNHKLTIVGRSRGKSISEIGNLLIANGVPLKPDVFIERPELVNEIREALKAMANKSGWVLVHGAGGIGKTTVVSQALRDPSLLNEQHYQDGIVWFKVGHLKSNEEFLVKMNSLISRLERGHSVSCLTLDEAQNRLRESLVSERPKTLLVLDDVWGSSFARWFSVGGTILVTSRDAHVLKKVQGKVRPVEVKTGFTLEESNDVFAQTLEIEKNALPDEATKLWRLCGGSPLAICMFAALLSDKPDRWQYYVKMLDEHRLDRMKVQSSYDHEFLHECVTISINELDEELRIFYRKLAVFGRGRNFSPAVVATLWEEDEIEIVEDTLDTFVKKSLAWREWNGETKGYMYGIHDLQHHTLHFLEKKSDPDHKKKLNEDLLKCYQKKCADGRWHNLPRDGYIFWFIGSHLCNAGREEEFVSLLTDLEFIEAKSAETGPTDIINDYLIYEKLLTRYGKAEEMQSFLSFVQRHANLINGSLQEQSGSVVQLGLFQEKDSPVFKEAYRLAESRKSSGVPHWLWKNSDMASTKALLRVQVRRSFIYSVDIDPSGCKLLVSNRDGLVVLLDASTGHEICSFEVDSSEVYRAVFIGDGMRFLTCSDSGYIRFFKLPDYARQPHVCRLDSQGEKTDHCWHAPDSNVAHGVGQPERLNPKALAEMCQCAVYPPYRDPVEEQHLVPRCCCVGNNTVHVGCLDGTVARYTLTIDDGTAPDRPSTDGIFSAADRPAHADAIVSIALSPCARFVASAGVDRQVIVYDMEEMEVVCRYRAHQAVVIASLFVPSQEGQMVSASANEIHIWTISGTDPKPDRQIESPRNNNFMSLAVSNNAQYIAAGMANNAIKLWKFSTAEVLFEFWGHNGCPVSLCFDAQSRRLFSVGVDATLQAWDLSPTSGSVRDGDGVVVQLKPSIGVHWGGDGRGALVAGQDLHSGGLLLLDAASGEVLHAGPPLHWRAVELALTADGRRLALGTEQGRVLQYVLLPGNGFKVESQPCWAPPGHGADGGSGDSDDRDVVAMRFVCGDKRLAVGLNDGQLWLLPALDTAEPQELLGHSDKVSALLEVTEPRSSLLSASYDGSVRLWPLDADGHAQLEAVEVICTDEHSVYSIDFLPERNWLLIARTGKAEVWKMDQRQLLCSFTDHKDCVRVCRFCPWRPGLAATGEDSGVVQVWTVDREGDVRLVTTLTRPAADPEYWINDVVWLSADRLLTMSGCVRMWAANSGAILQTFHPLGSEVTQVSVRPDSNGASLVAVDTAGTLYVLESVQ